MTVTRVESPEHWHALRAENVGSSETAALFGEHPQLTPFELFLRKSGNLPAPDLSDDERVQWGNILEGAIAEGTRQRTGWVIRKVYRYHSRPELKLGASLDFEILSHPRGPGILEIKTADWLVARRWNGEVPLHHQLQVQHALAACGRAWGAIAMLVGGNELRLHEFERRERTIGLIEQRVAAFWASVASGTPPEPDFARDGETIAQLYRDSVPGSVVDLSDSRRLAELIEVYQSAALARRAHEKTAKAARAEIMMLMGDAEMALCGEWRLKAPTIADIADRVVDESMIGETIKGRSGYRGLYVSKHKDQ